MQVRRNPEPTDELLAALVGIWVDVTNAGGTVGFDAPVTAEDVRPVAERSLTLVRRGCADLAVAVDRARVLGFGFLLLNASGLQRHWGSVRSLQRHPGARDRGVGAALLAELEAAARDRGLDRIELTVRGGTGRERFYTARGFAVDAVLPGRLQLADGSLRDEVVLAKWLTPVETGAVLRVQRLDRGLPLPAYAHPGDAGLDLCAREDVTLAPGERAVVGTGVAIAVPPGCVGLVHPRSGLAARHGIGMVNAPGTVDAGYRGELKVVLVNHDLAEPVTLRRGERVAQLVVQRVETVRVVESAALDATARGTGGFGSTGR